ncbi:MAG: bifunctional UDP-N-acetylglucosamine diphosphorylase/glucosamine-1-phosphate N-acetyltransferase GlmU [Acidobacteriaceae bacterium]|nr:bifunctional UDP-N-acetylglucosamine diphosphorylase/glucosamine-1-phosphate N-acetyltransferase GlmU [Acidobacteriaceae bacterium]MBV9679093.1 bifunctional UDP-N-acetylglucosamine diphosphorylase/glucosamine-1-phosphate N-acetyltransferase GlmU [Acidobacteriaceae bacterium]
MTENVRVVILAAGLGTRMRSMVAKVLHEAGGDTLLNHVIRAALHVAPAENIVAVVGHQAEQVRQSVKFPGVRFAEQKEQKGTGHAVLCAREEVGMNGGRLLILNGDGPLLRPPTLQALLQESSGSDGGSIVTTEVADATGYGRIVRDPDGTVAAIVEQKASTPEQLQIREINPGVYCFNAGLFWQYIEEIKPDNPAKEYYLTDMVAIMKRHGHSITPLLVKDETELLGINTRVELAVADKLLRRRKTQELMLSGVTIENPESVTVDVDVQVGEDSLIESNVHLRGRTQVGANCRIGTGTVLRDCEVADNVTVLPYVVADSAKVGRGASIGPFSRLRLHAEAEEDTHIGNFVELKKTKLGRGSKASHLAYLGDAIIGSGANIGAGTITCNYDGVRKHQTTIGEGAFIGSNSTLVAPLTVDDGAFVAAGSTITKNVEADALAIGRAYQVDKPGWAKKRRTSNGNGS